MREQTREEKVVTEENVLETMKGMYRCDRIRREYLDHAPDREDDPEQEEMWRELEENYHKFEEYSRLYPEKWRLFEEWRRHPDDE
jgi:hypothetical protein